MALAEQVRRDKKATGRQLVGECEHSEPEESFENRGTVSKSLCFRCQQFMDSPRSLRFTAAWPNEEAGWM